MNRPFTIGTFFSRDLRLHWSYLLLPFGVAIYSAATLGWQAAVFHVALLLAAYLCVLVHEAWQFLVARRYGIGTRDLTIYPFWGVSRPMCLSDRPWQERYIAGTGPLVFLLIAIVVAGTILVSGTIFARPDQVSELTWRTFWNQVFWITIALAVLHSLPLLPLDGGRLLRAGLALRGSRLWATEIAAVATTVGAGIMLFSAIVWLDSIMLSLIAVLVFLGAQEDLGTTRYFDRLREGRSKLVKPALRVPIDQIATPDPQPVDPDFSGFTWNANACLWIEWRNGRPIAANALVGDRRR